MTKISMVFGLVFVSFLAACQAPTPVASDLPRVMAAEVFLADIAQVVAGDRLQVDSLMPSGADPHTYEPIPSDLVRISQAQVMIVNGAGFETWIDPLLESASGERLVITASAGLAPREAPKHHEEEALEEEHADEHAHSVDPHFWLDPLLVVRYVENIRDGLSTVDPEGAEIYAQNAAAYISELRALDEWIVSQIAAIAPERRLMVTNHESFGYYADRYGLEIVGAILPSFSTGATPSSQQVVELVEAIQEMGAAAIFLETSASPEMAQQIAEQTGAKVITGLYTHALSDLDGPAPTYLDMMRYNTTQIVEALR
jgi:ABC-type Zn uptake system ZnuABC Zn-binding protein ZnuA